MERVISLELIMNNSSKIIALILECMRIYNMCSTITIFLYFDTPMHVLIYLCASMCVGFKNGFVILILLFDTFIF